MTFYWLLTGNIFKRCLLFLGNNNFLERGIKRSNHLFRYQSILNPQGSFYNNCSKPKHKERYLKGSYEPGTWFIACLGNNRSVPRHRHLIARLKRRGLNMRMGQDVRFLRQYPQKYRTWLKKWIVHPQTDLFCASCQFSYNVTGT